MPRDFAKNKKSSTRGASRKKSSRKPFPTTAVVIVSLLIAGFAGGLYWLKTRSPEAKQPATANNQSPNQRPKPDATKKPAPTRTNKSKEPEVPLYEAHEEMVNKEVVIPAEDLKLPDTAGKYYYKMRCGSFREQSRAEELKAKIALSGFESQILEVKSGSSLWHRVELGPYQSKRKAESIRHRLQRNDIIDCIIDRKIKPQGDS